MWHAGSLVLRLEYCGRFVPASGRSAERELSEPWPKTPQVPVLSLQSAPGCLFARRAGSIITCPVRGRTEGPWTRRAGVAAGDPDRARPGESACRCRQAHPRRTPAATGLPTFMDEIAAAIPDDLATLRPEDIRVEAGFADLVFPPARACHRRPRPSVSQGTSGEPATVGPAKVRRRPTGSRAGRSAARVSAPVIDRPPPPASPPPASSARNGCRRPGPRAGTNSVLRPPLTWRSTWSARSKSRPLRFVADAGSPDDPGKWSSSRVGSARLVTLGLIGIASAFIAGLLDGPLFLENRPT